MSEQVMTITNAVLARRVAKAIRKTAKWFSMGKWVHQTCGAPSCLAGHIAALSLEPNEFMGDDYIYKIDDVAALKALTEFDGGDGVRLPHGQSQTDYVAGFGVQVERICTRACRALGLKDLRRSNSINYGEGWGMFSPDVWSGDWPMAFKERWGKAQPDQYYDKDDERERQSAVAADMLDHLADQRDEALAAVARGEVSV